MVQSHLLCLVTYRINKALKHQFEPEKEEISLVTYRINKALKQCC